jgi:drug/metabolite transporter (DMT)-like permease
VLIHVVPPEPELRLAAIVATGYRCAKGPARCYTVVVVLALAALAAVLYGVSDYFGGRSARRIPAVTAALIGEAVLLAGALVLVALDDTPATWDALGWGVVAGVGGVGGVVLFYAALAHGSMSVAAPVTGVVSAVLPVAIGLVLGERPGGSALLGIAVALVAVALVGGAGGSGTVSGRQLLLAVTAGAAFGSWFIALERAGDDTGWWPLLGSRLLGAPALVVAQVVLSRHRRERRLAVVQPWRDRVAIAWSVSAAVVILSANVVYLVAVRQGLLSIVAVIVSLYPASTVLLAVVIDRERLRPSQIVGLVLAVLALSMVAGAT